jgi:hypothetical protein
MYSSVQIKIYWTYFQFTAGHSGHVVWGRGLDCMDAKIVGSNPAQGMDVCPCLFIIIIHLSPYQRYIV